ncbi:MAG: hypothetical protein ABI171_12635 [Collimonas sp.]|uniref:beta strand repeat-containing protein n=1 Tax=Collimonas sp. TaxID=1963772 RepID=UPI003267C49A
MIAPHFRRGSFFFVILISVSGFLWSTAVSAQVTGVNKSFNPVQIQDRAPFNISHLSIVIANQTPGKTLTNFNLTDNLPGGVTVAANPDIVNACGATLAATPGATLVTVNGGSAQFGDICTFQVDVVSTTSSIYTNTIPAGGPLADGEVIPQAASASLTVIRHDTAQPQVSAKTFVPNNIVSGQTSQMTITLNNTNILPLTNTNLNDSFPAGMTVANAGATTTCGGTLNAAPGANQFSLAGATIPASGTCTVTMQVVGDSASAASTVNMSNTIRGGDLTSLNGQVTPPLANTGATTGTLAVSPQPTDRLTKSFSLVNAFVGQAFSMTWTIYNDTGAAWTGLGVSDALPGNMTVYATAPGFSTTCSGGAVSSPAANTVRLANASLGAGQTCTVTAKVIVPAAADGQPFTNTIPANSMVANGAPLVHNAASATVILQNPGVGQVPTLISVGKNYVQLVTEAALTQAAPLPVGHAPGTVTGGLIDMTIQLNKIVPVGGVDTDLKPLFFADDWSATAPNLRVFALQSNSCGGTVTATAGSQTMTLNNGLIAQGGAGNCVIKVRLKADSNFVPPPLGTPQSNTVIACTGAGPCAAGSHTATANAVVVGVPPLFPAKSFNPTSLPLNGVTKATITIQNPAATTRFNVQAVDTLPGGLMFSTPLNGAVSCTNNAGGTPSFQTSGKTLTLKVTQLLGFNISTTAPQCTITFDVVADPSSPLAVAGATATNSILANAVTATDAGGNPDASATNVRPVDANLTFKANVQAPLVSKGFNPIVVFQENGNGKIDSNIQGTGVGELSTLTLQIINPNSTAAGNFTGLSLSDALPAGVVVAFAPNVTKLNCGAPAVTAAAGAQTINITNATVSFGNSCVVTVDVIGTAKGNQINTIPVNAVQTTQGVSNAQPASATLTVLGINPISALNKDVVKTGGSTSLQGQAILAGDNLTYIIKLSNPGYLPLVLATNVQQVADVLPAGTTFVSTAGSDVAGVLSGNKVVWDLTTSGRILKRSEFITLMLNVKVNTPVTETLVNVATTPTSSSCSPSNSVACNFNPPNANCRLPQDPLHETPAELLDPTVCNPVVNPIANASLKITKTHSGNFTVGGSGSYNLAISNDGLAPSSGAIHISDLLPAGISLQTNSISSANGSVSNIVVSGQLLNFDFTPVAPIPSTGVVNLTYAVNVAAGAVGSLTNYVSMNGGDSFTGRQPPGTSCTDSMHCSSDTTAITDAPALKLVKSHTGNIVAGANGNYTLTISNSGDVATNGAIHLSDLLPAGFSLLPNSIASAAGGIGNIVISGQSLSFDLTPAAPIPPKGSVSVNYGISVALSTGGSLTNYASVSGGGDPTSPLTPGAACSDANRCSTDIAAIAAPASSLKLVKSHLGSFSAGASGNYTIAISNQKGGASSGAIHIQDLLPVGMSLAPGSVTSTAGSISNVTSSGQNVAFDFTPTIPLAVGASVSLTYGVNVAATANGTLTNYANVSGGGDLFTPLTPGTSCNDSNHCSNDATSIISATVLVVVETTTKKEAELGDLVTYTVNVTNTGDAAVAKPNIVIDLPNGFRAVGNSTHVSGATLVKQDGSPGPVLTTVVDVINPHSSVTATTRVRLGVGAMNGDGVSRATATCPGNSKVNCANQAQVKVRVTGGVFTNDACVVGMIFVDCNGNQIKDKEELGIPGVRLYVEDGTFLISDVEGKYSYCGLSPRTHVLKVDQTTLPRGSRLVVSSNRNVGDANSLFLDLKNGELQRADFIEGSCSNPVMEQVKARRAQGEIDAPQTEKKRGAVLKFEGKAPDYPQEGTDSANQAIVKPRASGVGDPPPVPETRSERDTPLQQLQMQQPPLQQGGDHAQ